MIASKKPWVPPTTALRSAESQSRTCPKDIDTFALALRQTLIEVANTRQAQAGQETKMKLSTNICPRHWPELTLHVSLPSP